MGISLKVLSFNSTQTVGKQISNQNKNMAASLKKTKSLKFLNFASDQL